MKLYKPSSCLILPLFRNQPIHFFQNWHFLYVNFQYGTDNKRKFSSGIINLFLKMRLLKIIAIFDLVTCHTENSMDPSTCPYVQRKLYWKKYVFPSVPNLNEACKADCAIGTSECVSKCAPEDTNCWRDCFREDTICIDRKNAF